MTHPRSVHPENRARRRRSRRSITGLSRDERALFTEKLAQRAYPSLDFFTKALVSGLIIALAWLLDEPILLLLGVLLAPSMLPWSGVTLSIVTGSARYFFQTLIALLVGGLFYFLTGLISGLAARFWPELPFSLAYRLSHLWWPTLAVLALGAIWMNRQFVMQESPAPRAGFLIVWGLYLPLSAAGLGLGSGRSGLFPEGALVALVHLGWLAFFGTITLFLLGLRPLSFLGLTFGSSIVLALIVLLAAVSGLGAMLQSQLGITTTTASPTPFTVVSPTPTSLPLPPPATPTFPPTPTPLPPVQPTATPTPEKPLTAAETASPTPSPQPTPIYARVDVRAGNGVLVRESPPDGKIVTSLLNGYLVIVYPEQFIAPDGTVWVRIEATLSDGRVVQGWVAQYWLATATPSANW